MFLLLILIVIISNTHVYESLTFLTRTATFINIITTVYSDDGSNDNDENIKLTIIYCYLLSLFIIIHLLSFFFFRIYHYYFIIIIIITSAKEFMYSWLVCQQNIRFVLLFFFIIGVA